MNIIYPMGGIETDLKRNPQVKNHTKRMKSVIEQRDIRGLYLYFSNSHLILV